MKELVRTYVDYLKTAVTSAAAATIVFSFHSFVEKQYHTQREIIDCYVCTISTGMLIVLSYITLKLLLFRTDLGDHIRQLIKDLLHKRKKKNGKRHDKDSK